MSFWKSWFLTSRTYVVLYSLTVPAIASVWVPILYPVSLTLLCAVVVVVVWDTVFLWLGQAHVQATRSMDERLSNGDHNAVRIRLVNRYRKRVYVTVLDELPAQFQKRDFALHVWLDVEQPRDVEYSVRPVERGVYSFGAVNVIVQGTLGFVKRRFSWSANQQCSVYPSVMEMRRAELQALSQQHIPHGQRRLRRLGHTMEFEKIKGYVRGDDIRSLNWKATARSSGLMVNLYQDERSQDVVSVLDTGRVMQAPFNGMTSLDYAVNASLAFSNVVLRKHDRAGLVVYGSRGSTMVLPGSSPSQLGRLNEALYNVRTDFHESNDEFAVLRLTTSLRQRSLVMLYTNIDAMSTLQRRFPRLH